MNNDLISREALIEDFKSRLVDCNDWIENAKDKETKIRASAVKTFIAEVILTINNAPTVEPFEPNYVGAERLKARQRGYEEGYHYGMKIGKTLNPKIKQGEWISVKERLPEKRGVYIVTEKVFSLDDREHKGRYNTMVEQVEYCNGKWHRAWFFEVIAWQPLPEPHKKEGAE